MEIHKKAYFWDILYTFWCVFCLISIFLLLFPIVFVALQRKKWHAFAHRCNWLWGQLFFPLIGVSVNIEYRFRPDPKQTYMFCANHFSYIDVALMQAVLANHFAFMGKSSVKGIPLLGYMFLKLHIQVDRNEKDSRTKALTRSIRAIKEGRSVVIFPEGGIRIDPSGIYQGETPQMVKPLKDGAFSIALETQVPIVPISFLDNHRLMPETTFRWQRRLRVVIHPPIETVGKSRKEIETLKNSFYDTVQGSI